MPLHLSTERESDRRSITTKELETGCGEGVLECPHDYPKGRT